MSRNILWQLLPKFPLELLDQFTFVCEHQNAPRINDSISEQLSGSFSHHNCLSKPCGEH
uniref:Uncharacterized protein n=1 Tax=Ralstonia solanacearum TaxID=305 RepID=A0A0S4WJP9_RALSL|nr:protein of unknown function [Ralstonia solanacearum]